MAACRPCPKSPSTGKLLEHIQANVFPDLKGAIQAMTMDPNASTGLGQSGEARALQSTKSFFSSYLLSGRAGFFIWLCLFLGWVAFLAFQVATNRPDSKQIQDGPASLPRRAQLNFATGVWLISIQENHAPTKIECLAGFPPPHPIEQLEIDQLSTALKKANLEIHDANNTRQWIVPVVSFPSQPNGFVNEAAKIGSLWRVAPIPADPSNPNGEDGRIFPATPFNRDLVKSWWKKTN